MPARLFWPPARRSACRQITQRGRRALGGGRFRTPGRGAGPARDASPSRIDDGAAPRTLARARRTATTASRRADILYYSRWVAVVARSARARALAPRSGAAAGRGSGWPLPDTDPGRPGVVGCTGRDARRRRAARRARPVLAGELGEPTRCAEHSLRRPWWPVSKATSRPASASSSAQLAIAEGCGNLDEQARAHGYLGVAIHLRGDADGDAEQYDAADDALPGRIDSIAGWASGQLRDPDDAEPGAGICPTRLGSRGDCPHPRALAMAVSLRPLDSRTLFSQSKRSPSHPRRNRKSALPISGCSCASPPPAPSTSTRPTGSSPDVADTRGNRTRVGGWDRLDLDTVLQDLLRPGTDVLRYINLDLIGYLRRGTVGSVQPTVARAPAMRRRARTSSRLRLLADPATRRRSSNAER